MKIMHFADCKCCIEVELEGIVEKQLKFQKFLSTLLIDLHSHLVLNRRRASEQFLYFERGEVISLELNTVLDLGISCKWPF